MSPNWQHWKNSIPVVIIDYEVWHSIWLHWSTAANQFKSKINKPCSAYTHQLSHLPKKSWISHSGELHYTTPQPVMFAYEEYTLVDWSLHAVCPPVTHQCVFFAQRIIFDKPILIILTFLNYIKISTLYLHYIIMISYIYDIHHHIGRKIYFLFMYICRWNDSCLSF